MIAECPICNNKLEVILNEGDKKCFSFYEYICERKDHYYYLHSNKIVIRLCEYEIYWYFPIKELNIYYKNRLYVVPWFDPEYDLEKLLLKVKTYLTFS